MRYDISFINLIIPDKVLKDVQLVQLWCNYPLKSAINHTKSYIK